jgi:nicotinamide-nucleotide amidase
VLSGRIGDRNGGFLARSLSEAGLDHTQTVVIGDSREGICATVSGLLADGIDLIVTSGGLGVTHDDVSMAAVAQSVGAELALREDVLTEVRERMTGAPNRDRVSPHIQEEGMRKQAMLPAGATALSPVGTAAGCIAETPAGQLVVVLPGPPGELERMWEQALLTPPLSTFLDAIEPPTQRVFRLFGVIESQLVELLADLPDDPLDGLRLGICARAGELEVTLTEIAASGAGSAQRLLDAMGHAFGDALFSQEGASLDAIIADQLAAAGQTVVVAESCTGGLLGARLTAQAGASGWFLGGVISYSNSVKQGILGVPPELIERLGAVSALCAEAMAEGARHTLGADWALSITGIAGPGGGTADKPVGLVYVACAGLRGTTVSEFRFRGTREQIRERAVANALQLLRVAMDAAQRDGEHRPAD